MGINSQRQINRKVGGSGGRNLMNSHEPLI